MHALTLERVAPAATPAYPLGLHSAMHLARHVLYRRQLPGVDALLLPQREKIRPATPPFTPVRSPRSSRNPWIVPVHCRGNASDFRFWPDAAYRVSQRRQAQEGARKTWWEKTRF
jgi:hypothetical protein